PAPPSPAGCWRVTSGSVWTDVAAPSITSSSNGSGGVSNMKRSICTITGPSRKRSVAWIGTSSFTTMSACTSHSATGHLKQFSKNELDNLVGDTIHLKKLHSGLENGVHLNLYNKVDRDQPRPCFSQSGLLRASIQRICVQLL